MKASPWLQQVLSFNSEFNKDGYPIKSDIRFFIFMHEYGAKKAKKIDKRHVKCYNEYSNIFLFMIYS